MRHRGKSSSRLLRTGLIIGIAALSLAAVVAAVRTGPSTSDTGAPVESSAPAPPRLTPAYEPEARELAHPLVVDDDIDVPAGELPAYRWSQPSDPQARIQVLARSLGLPDTFRIQHHPAAQGHPDNYWTITGPRGKSLGLVVFDDPELSWSYFAHDRRDPRLRPADNTTDAAESTMRGLMEQLGVDGYVLSEQPSVAVSMGVRIEAALPLSGILTPPLWTMDVLGGSLILDATGALSTLEAGPTYPTLSAAQAAENAVQQFDVTRTTPLVTVSRSTVGPVHIEQVTRTWMPDETADGDEWLLPGFEYRAHDSRRYRALAIPDTYLT